MSRSEVEYGDDDCMTDLDMLNGGLGTTPRITQADGSLQACCGL